MAESLVIDWLDENSLRSYPLGAYKDIVAGSYTLPNDVLVDAKFYSYADADVELQAISATDDAVTITTSIATFVVSRPQIVDFFPTYAAFQLIVTGNGINDIPNGDYTFSGVYFSKGVTRYVKDYWTGVTSVSINALSAATGNVRMMGGIQTQLTDKNTAIQFEVGKNLGIPLDKCQSYGTLPDDCGTQISYINGIAPDALGAFTVYAGSGLSIVTDPDNHRIFIGLDFKTTDVCPVIPPT